jgi:cellulose synthase/poly-beta-1,6-N-acetylglucosamine synthase-like glycosyltransferase
VKILFWTSCGLILYAYAGYPAVLWVWTRLWSRPVQRGRIRPPITVIVAARNEADKIRDKIQNTLALDYPLSLLEVIVASDASDDGTDEIVRQHAAQGVRLVRSPQRGGKEYAQGLAVAVAKGDIVVFTDAATLLEGDALKRLVENFTDPAVGAVSTEDLLLDSAEAPTGEGLYVKYEMWVRRLESRFYGLVGLSGSCFAIRKELCSSWSPSLASDFMAALRSARRGYRSIVDPSVRGRFPTVVSARQEIQRKIRTFLRGIAVLMANLDMMNPFMFGRFAFQLASHKMMRFIVPFLLLTSLISTGFLMDDRPFQLFFWVQGGVYALGIIGGLVPRLQRNRYIRAMAYFVLVQWAMLTAWWKFLQGEQQVVWEPSKRRLSIVGDHASPR